MTVTTIEDGTMVVQHNRSRGLVRLVVGRCPIIISSDLSPSKAREIGQALIDAADIADARPPPIRNCSTCRWEDDDEPGLCAYIRGPCIDLSHRLWEPRCRGRGGV